jgi:hypothetical protein
MRLLVVVILCVMLGPSAVGQAMFGRALFGQKEKCSAEQMTKFEDESSKVRNWVLLHKFYLRYHMCGVEDAVVEQGMGTAVARLLVDSWSTLPAGSKLMEQDHGFRKVVLSGINAAVADDDLKAIRGNSRDACPAGEQVLCGQMQKAAEESLKAGTDANDAPS